MRFKIESFKSFDKNSWNKALEEMEGNLHFCTWQSIEYYSAFQNIKNISFVIKEENQIKAMVPLAINKNKKKNLSFNEGFIFSPVFKKSIKQSLKKKIYEFIFEHVKSSYKIIRSIKFLISPVMFREKKVIISSKNQFELLWKNSNIRINNTLIQDLDKDMADLENQMSKYHRKNIKKSLKKNIEFKVFNSRNGDKEISNEFKRFRKLHLLSAGRKTRPMKTWKIMENLIKDDLADLFSINYEKKPISYLYCGRYKNFSWGWSQVNLRSYEKEIMPRHMLEWKVMLYYKNIKQSFYEIGIRYVKQKNFIPTKKELTISEFKEKYGSDSYPRAEIEIRI